MRYYKVSKDKPDVKTVVYMKNPEEVLTPYPEFVPSYWEWILPQEQVKIANRLNEITKPHNRETDIH
ncbi:MAG: hypothetical protein K0R50_2484 [Eubacterium sp.]|jgi:hypothetical protein|nr:hypothetical protein [Eubacterium sp.]